MLDQLQGYVKELGDLDETAAEVCDDIWMLWSIDHQITTKRANMYVQNETNTNIYLSMLYRSILVWPFL